MNSRFRASTWSYRVDLSPSDTIRLRNVIAAERGYFNALVTGLNGPMRTMGETLRGLTGRWEGIVGLVAETRTDLRNVKAANPGIFAEYADLLFENGRSKIDSKTQVFMDIAAQAGDFNAKARRNMAVEMFKHAREQSAALANTMNREDQVLRYAVETIVPLDPGSKRHVQLPKSAVTVEMVEQDGEKMQKIILPYLTAPIVVPEPPLDWNYLILREDTDGRHTLEMCRETNAQYLLKRTDHVRLQKKRQTRARAGAR